MLECAVDYVIFLGWFSFKDKIFIAFMKNSNSSGSAPFATLLLVSGK